MSSIAAYRYWQIDPRFLHVQYLAPPPDPITCKQMKETKVFAPFLPLLSALHFPLNYIWKLHGSRVNLVNDWKQTSRRLPQKRIVVWLFPPHLESGFFPVVMARVPSFPVLPKWCLSESSSPSPSSSPSDRWIERRKGAKTMIHFPFLLFSIQQPPFWHTLIRRRRGGTGGGEPKTTPPTGGPPYVVLFPPPGCRRRPKNLILPVNLSIFAVLQNY